MENYVSSGTSKFIMDALPSDDLFLCLRPILVAGKLVIAVPLSGVLRLNKQKLPTFTLWKNIPVVVFTMIVTVRCLAAIVDLGLNIVLKTSGFFGLFRRAMLLVIGNACNIHMLGKAPALCKLFALWRKMNTRTWLLGHRSNLRRKIPTIGGLLFCTIFIENWIITLHLAAERMEPAGSNNLTFLAALVETDEFTISTAFPDYSLIIGLILFIVDKLSLYQSAIRAILCISLTIAIESKLEALISRINVPPVNWGAARRDFLSIMKIIDMVNNVVSVFLFQTLTTNLVFTTYLIYSAVAPDEKDLEDGIYTILALMYFLMRLFFLCIPAGNIYRASQRIWTIIQQSPAREHDLEAQHLERLVTQPVGISCMGLFTITRSFILCFVNTVFTILILMLQAGTKTQIY